MAHSPGFWKFERFLRDLRITNPKAFLEIETSPGFINSATIDAVKMSKEDLSFLMRLYAQYGECPELKLRNYRKVISEEDSFHSDNIINVKKALIQPSKFHQNHLEKIEQKFEIHFSDLHLKHMEWSYLSKKQLYQMLLGAESEDDFEECALIRDYAASKGWELK